MRIWDVVKRSSFTDWCLTVFTGILAATSIYQFMVMTGQLDEMRNDQRPWVGLKGVTVPQIVPNQYATGVTTFANTGRSPALDLSVVGTLFVTSYPDAELPEESPEGHVTHYVATPGIDQTLAVHSSRPITQAEYDLAQGLNVRFYFYGHGQYRDTSTAKRTHHFQYCVFLQSKAPGVTPCTAKTYTNTTD